MQTMGCQTLEDIHGTILLNERNQRIFKEIRENYGNKRTPKLKNSNVNTSQNNIIEAEIIEAELL